MTSQPTRTVLLHVGTPKTGTSHLQDVLFRNREALAEQGVHYPAERFDAHFLAALDLMRLPWGGLEHEAIGAWDALADSVRDVTGTIIVSHEILATASRQQVGRALASLGHGRADTEVHVIVSVRDLVRQIPAEWQENVKHRRVIRYRDFLDEIREPERTGTIATWFWGVQEIPDILNRWAHDLPPDHVHLVTVPPSGSPRGILWERFSRTFGLDGLTLDVTEERANPSLGVPETALIRRLNVAVNAELPPGDYRPLVRELLAHRTLSQRTSSRRLTLPPTDHQWVRDLEDAWIAEVEARGYQVCGSLAELRGAPPVTDYADPDHPDEAAVASAGIDSLRVLLLELAETKAHAGRVEDELHHTKLALDRALLRPSYIRRERTVRRLEGSRAGRVLLRLYRRGRGNNSRSA
ncbi:MAG: hypothetical protein V9G04_18795 [Nocardioides sp.]